MESSQSFLPQWASPPGATILDVLDENGLSTEQFSTLIGVTLIQAKRLLAGKAPVTEEIAEKLGEHIGSTKHFWLTREDQYQEDLQRLQEIERENREWLKLIPTADMVRHGWLAPSRSHVEKLQKCLNYFDVTSAREWYDSYRQLSSIAAFRTSFSFDSQPEAVITWLRQGIHQSEAAACEPWDKEKFRTAVIESRSLTREKDPQVFIPALKQLFAVCGVVLEALPTPSKCRASGATFFVKPDKALMLLSFRYLSDDQFWFSLYHEAGHLLLHGERSVFLEVKGAQTSVEEAEANLFAENVLIPQERKAEMAKLNAREWKKIVRFAKSIGISPGLVVGQLQHRGVLRHDQFNKLKARYKWSDIRGT